MSINENSDMEKIKKMINELQSKNVSNSKNLSSLTIKMQALITSLQSLADILAKAQEQCKDLKELNDMNKTKAISHTPQYIDGKRLSSNEAAFEEYYEEKFNEKSWAKKHKIILDDPTK